MGIVLVAVAVELVILGVAVTVMGLRAVHRETKAMSGRIAPVPDNVASWLRRGGERK